MAANDAILVIGGGIAGLSAAVEAAEVGHEVILVEKAPYLGGRVLAMNSYFPKLCPPTCGLEINFRRIRNNPRIQVYTNAEVESISGQRGEYAVTIRIDPAVELAEGEQSLLAAAEPKPAVAPGAEAQTVQAQAGAIIIATGWKPYDAANLDTLAPDHADVMANVDFEQHVRDGKLVRPSTGEAPKSVAFVQCAGSRDTNHRAYCSGVCCMGSLKQARYVRELAPEASVSIFYIDIRTIGRHEEFYYELNADENVRFVKGKVARITPEGDGLRLHVEDTLAGALLDEKFDMVVLATGVVPNWEDDPVPGADVVTDDYGFIVGGEERNGIYAVGCARRPTDVSRSVKDATAAVLRAMQDVRR